MIATVESVILYGCETWTLINNVIKKKLDVTYTRILRMVLDIHWSSKIKNTLLYGELERLSNKIRRMRLKFAGNCIRKEYEVVSDLVLWQPNHGARRRIRPRDSNIKTLEHDES